MSARPPGNTSAHQNVGVEDDLSLPKVTIQILLGKDALRTRLAAPVALQVTQLLKTAYATREAQGILDDRAERLAFCARQRLGIPREIRWQGDGFRDRDAHLSP